MKKKSFTLTEILIVLVVAGILATLGFPAYQKVVEDSRARACEANLQALKTALDIYAMENDLMPAGLAALPQDYLKRAYASLMQQKGAWKIKLAYFITDFSRERNLAYAEPFFLNRIAKGDRNLVTCPKDTDFDEFGSYGGNAAWVGQSTRVYRQLVDTTSVIGDSESAQFSLDTDLETRHREPGLFSSQDYAISIDRKTKIKKKLKEAISSDTSLNTEGPS